MTIKETLVKYRKSINPDETELLLSHLLKCSKEDLYIKSDKNVSKLIENKLKKLISERIKGIPSAYLLGYKYFYGLKFKVSRHVLIPRPESEWLVEKAIECITKKLKTSKNVKVLEIGTGSGCLSISTAMNIKSKNVKFLATDISGLALKVAKENAKTYKVTVKFAKHDLLTGIEGKFDLIIANLPYVPLKDYKKLYKNLKYEPKLALTDSTNNFILINKLLSQIKSYLTPNGMVMLEIDPKTTPNISSYKPKIYQDIHKLDRFAIIKNELTQS